MSQREELKGNIHLMPASTSMLPEQALDSAKLLGMSEVLVIGYSSDGRFVTRSSRMSRKDALWLIELARCYTLKPTSLE